MARQHGQSPGKRRHLENEATAPRTESNKALLVDLRGVMLDVRKHGNASSAGPAALIKSLTGSIIHQNTMGEDWSDRLIGAAYSKGNSSPRRWVWPVTLAAVLPCLLLAAFLFQGQVRIGDMTGAVRTQKAGAYGSVQALEASLASLQSEVKAASQKAARSAVSLQQEQRAAAERLARVEKALHSLPETVGWAAAQGQAPSQEGGASLCSKISSAFARPPPVIDLPTYPLPPGKVSADAPFARFQLQPAVVAKSQRGDRKLSLYAYHSNDTVSQEILQSGSWELQLIEGVLNQLYRFAEEKGLAPKDVYFVDVGGNIGTFSLSVAAHGFSVLTFEAMFANAQTIRHSICANPGMEERVTLVNKGLGKEPGKCVIYSGANNRGNGFLRCGADAEKLHPGMQGVKRGELEIVRLDDYLQGRFPALTGRVGAMKIDVEGFEGLVTEGALEFFKQVRPPYVVSECHDKMMEIAQGGDPSAQKQYLAKMASLGYTVFDQSWKPISSPADYVCSDILTVFFSRNPEPNKS